MKIIPNTWAKDLNPTYQRLTETGSKLLIVATMTEACGSEEQLSPGLEEIFLIQVLQKRIDAFNLPISFSRAGKMAVLAFVDQPGATMALLIDCLNAYPRETVTCSKLVSLYPDGFYDHETMIRYIDNYLKPRKVEWSEIY